MTEFTCLQFVSSFAFEAMQKVDVVKLAALSDPELRLLLPCLVRMALCAPADQSDAWAQDKKLILRLLSGIEAVNSIVALLSVDFHALEQDATKEQQLRHKLGGANGESILVSQLQHGLALEFEHSDSPRRLRLALSELLVIMNKVTDSNGEFFMKSSELFESPVYLDEVADVLCILQAELPSLLPITEVAEALLHVKNGSWFMCLLVANVPDSFNEVCRSLIKNGERQDEESTGGRRRTEALRQLCKMNPTQALNVRAMVVEECHLPGLGIALTLDQCKNDGSDDTVTDLVSFVSGLLLGTNAKVRTWFGMFIRNGQQRKRERSSSVLWQMRRQLLLELMAILPTVSSSRIGEDTADTDMEPNISVYSALKEENVVKASAMLRLYCALMGIAGLKPTDEEAEQLLQLMTSRPPATPAGVRFVSLSFCMLLAFPSLVSTPEQEQMTVMWLSWMIREEAYFESTTGVSASFGEMLLLVAMYFHSNQLNAIIDLVCSTLGMKVILIAIKPSSLNRMKTIFTQEIFTEQVVTAHAVRVPVTSNLSAIITGFLPIHCIYQLLRSRAFTKHKVSIKDWIYRQMCETTTPLHPQLIPLIDVYINSILTPASKGNPEATNQPITEQEVLNVFNGLTWGENNRCRQRRSITAQLLVLYYTLSYEETLLSNIKPLAAMQKKPKSYSAALMDQIPIKYLIRQAQGLQQELGGLHSALLRLLATNFPHLCMVDDWMCEEEVTGTEVLLSRMLLTSRAKRHSPKKLQEAFQVASGNYTQLIQILEDLTLLSASELIPFAEALMLDLYKLLEPGVPRQILQIVNQLWRLLNTVMPRRLWVMTVNALQPKAKLLRQQKYTQNDLMIDPLIVLRCDRRVYRCPPLMDITLHMLNGYLLASKAYLSAHLKENADQDTKLYQNNTMGIVGQPDTPEVTREELKNALLSAQDSAAVQILLEICLPTEEERSCGAARFLEPLDQTGGLSECSEDSQDTLLSNVREVQCLICCLLHQLFIADPNIAKLVHFQGYPSELLPLTVAGIPSIHICLDFIPELLAQPQLEKQIFAIQLLSHLCIQYALPKSLSVARLSINVMGTILTVLTQAKRFAFFMPTLPCLVSFCRAFPPLCDDVTSLLIQTGQVCASHVATQAQDIDPIITRLKNLKENPHASANFYSSTDLEVIKKGENITESLDPDVLLCQRIEATFLEIINTAVVGV
ncbi:integrator complex subunit 2 isoform X1 [Mobula birostris]|uniref:integrator complex subunit 2 isoform X1 n=1 Tax=Mobula birostris TaxID=1983395 RepID=UPI003B28C977